MLKKDDGNQDALKIAFSKRLQAVMLEQGHKSKRDSQTPVDTFVLQKAAGVQSRDMARRYALGKSMPSREKLQKIAVWLGVREEWLAWGTLPKHPKTLVEQSVLAECIEAVISAARDTGHDLSPLLIAEIAVKIYTDALDEDMKVMAMKKMLEKVKMFS